ncbi:MAG: hypothetical protein NZ518_00535 [Dehalococcoidia bacterium]|nr:hypothetical protein [Dehalococcoidia bacterium]
MAQAPDLNAPLLLPAPEVAIPTASEAVLARLVQTVIAPTEPVLAKTPRGVPAYTLLQYLVTNAPIVLHPASRPTLTMLRPRRSLDRFGRSMTAVMATVDPLLALFVATLRTDLPDLGPLAHTATVETAAGPELRYAFAVNAARWAEAWAEGVIYCAPRTSFRPTPDPDGRPCDVWISTASVEPIAMLRTQPEDFPYRRAVYGYDPTALRERLADNAPGFPYLYDPAVYPIRPTTTR